MNKKQGKLRRLKLLGLGVFLATVLTPMTNYAAGDEIHGSNDFSVTYNDVTGPGAARQSSLTEGGSYLDVFNLFGNGSAGGFEYNWNVGAKATDDRRNDMKDFSLTNLQGRINNDIHSLTVGDTFESFSQYALSTAVKGGSYKFTPKEGSLPELTLLYGVAYSRWDNFWGVDTIDRQVMGGKINQKIGEEFRLGFSAVKTDDHGRINGSDLEEMQSYTVDWEYRPIPGLTISGESSWADGSTSHVSGSDTDYSGNAHKIVAIGDGGPSRVTLEFERVSPKFLTLVGSATPDREKAKAKWRYKFTKDLSITTAMLWYRNNLDDNRSDGTTNHYKPEISLTVKRPFNRQYAVADLSYKFDYTKSQTVNTVDQFINTSYRDRFGLFDSDTNLGVIFYDTEDTRKAQEYTYNTSLSSRHTVGSVVLKPTIYLGGWTSHEELEDPRTTDQIYEYSLGLGIDLAALKVTSNFKVGENRLDKEIGTDTTKTFGNINVFWRPESLNKLQGMLYAKGSVNDFRYDPSATSGSQNFRENSVTGGISLQF